jgi:hypothetical protein
MKIFGRGKGKGKDYSQDGAAKKALEDSLAESFARNVLEEGASSGAIRETNAKLIDNASPDWIRRGANMALSATQMREGAEAATYYQKEKRKQNKTARTNNLRMPPA